MLKPPRWLAKGTGRRRFLWRASAVLMALLLSACVSRSPVKPAGVALDTVEAGDGQPQWWYLRFRLAREDAQEVNSYLDMLIADRILAPLIVAERDEIVLWRFHRRWPNDATGHQFSLIVYTSVPVAQRLADNIGRSAVLSQLRDDGHLVQFRIDQPAEEVRFDIDATSDRAWPLPIQREWPHFIMGASHMWLALVQGAARDYPDMALYEKYQAVESDVDTLWFKHGNHAFFHHLSGLFGYRPIRVIRRDIMTF